MLIMSKCSSSLLIVKILWNLPRSISIGHWHLPTHLPSFLLPLAPSKLTTSQTLFTHNVYTCLLIYSMHTHIFMCTISQRFSHSGAYSCGLFLSHNILLCEYTTMYLSILLSMGVWAFSWLHTLWRTLWFFSISNFKSSTNSLNTLLVRVLKLREDKSLSCSHMAT